MSCPRTLFAAIACALLAYGSQSAAAADAKQPTKRYAPPRTPDGKPNLQGIWANNNATPLERPKSLAGRAQKNGKQQNSKAEFRAKIVSRIDS